MPRKLTQGEFIEKAVAKHRDKYDYSQVVYRGGQVKITVICKVVQNGDHHGPFEIRPNNHVNHGTGCPKCHPTAAIDKKEFFKRAKELHGDYYDYSKVVFVNQKTRITIICPVHGEFKQLIKSHVGAQKKGCMKCGHKKSAEASRKDIDHFLEKAKKIHGKTYDYSDVVYVNSGQNVEIGCPKHGSFWQTPDNHYAGRGCPICCESTGEVRIRTWLENRSIPFLSQKRFPGLTSVSYPRNKKTITQFSTTNAEDVLNEVKDTFPNANDNEDCFVDPVIDTLTSDNLDIDNCPNYHSSDDSIVNNDASTRLLEEILNEFPVCENRQPMRKPEGPEPVDNIAYDEAAMEEAMREHELFNPPYITPDVFGEEVCSDEEMVVPGIDESIVDIDSKSTVVEKKKVYRRGTLSYDFYLPSHNLLIEFDGIQHFQPVEFFGGEEVFKKQVRNDKIKTDYAREYGYELLRIAYNEDVNEKLLECLGDISYDSI